MKKRTTIRIGIASLFLIGAILLLAGYVTPKPKVLQKVDKIHHEVSGEAVDYPGPLPVLVSITYYDTCTVVVYKYHPEWLEDFDAYMDSTMPLAYVQIFNLWAGNVRVETLYPDTLVAAEYLEFHHVDGDLDGDGSCDISDLIVLIDYMFLNGALF